MSAGEQLGLKQDAAATQGPVVEQRHVEIIPENERHGRPRDQFTLWFAANANGVYGRIQWWACTCYVITLAVQVPFLDQTFYTGPFVKPLGGADISWIVGFAVASLLYLAGAKRFNSVRQGLPAAAGSAS
jgi:purine-cytosine permease-like protein